MPDRRVLIIYMAGFAGPLGFHAVLAMLRVLEIEFQVSQTQMLLSVPAFMFPFAILQFFSGIISDLYSRHRIVAVGFAIYAVASLGCTLATDLSGFLMARFLQGVGFAFISPVLLAMLGDLTSPERRGLAMGFFGVAITAGTASGPLIGGGVADVDWRIAFYLFAGLGVTLTLLFGAVFRMPVDAGERSEKGGRLDPWGVILLCAAGFLAFFAFSGAVSFAAAVLPAAPHSFTSLEVGLVITAAGVAGIFASPGAGALVDRLGRARTGLAGFGLTAAAIMLLSTASGILQFGLVLLTIGGGAALIWASLNTIAVELAPMSKGTVSSLYNGTRFLGFAAAVPLLTPVFDAGGVHSVYAFAAGASLISVGIVAGLGARLKSASAAP